MSIASNDIKRASTALERQNPSILGGYPAGWKWLERSPSDVWKIPTESHLYIKILYIYIYMYIYVYIIYVYILYGMIWVKCYIWIIDHL